MSTKMSTDLHVERSSTRTSAPPGGASSIFLGDYDGKEAPKPHPSRKQIPGTAASIRLDGSEAAAPATPGKKHIPSHSSAHILGAAPTVQATDETAIPSKKHVAGTKQATIYIGDNGPVDPVPPGRKHVNGVAESIHLVDEPEVLPPSPTSKKIIPSGSRTTISLNESNAPVETARRCRKQQGGSSNAGLSVFRLDAEPEAQKSVKKKVAGVSSSIDLSDKPVELSQKNHRKVFRPSNSELVLADDAPLVAAPMNRKHVSQGQSSIRFGEGVVEEMQSNRRRGPVAGQSSNMKDVLTRPADDEPPASPSKPPAAPSSPSKAPVASPSKAKVAAKTTPTKAKPSPAKAKVVTIPLSALTELVLESVPAEATTITTGPSAAQPQPPSKRPGVRSQQAPGGTSTLVLG